MRTTLAIAALVSALFISVAYAGNCTTTCQRFGSQTTCNTWCY